MRRTASNARLDRAYLRNTVESPMQTLKVFDRKISLRTGSNVNTQPSQMGRLLSPTFGGFRYAKSRDKTAVNTSKTSPLDRSRLSSAGPRPLEKKQEETQKLRNDQHNSQKENSISWTLPTAPSNRDISAMDSEDKSSPPTRVSSAQKLHPDRQLDSNKPVCDAILSSPPLKTHPNASSYVRRAIVGRSLFQYNQFKSPGPHDHKEKKSIQENYKYTTLSSASRVETIKSRLQDCLGDLNVKTQVSSKISASSSKKYKAAVGEPSVTETKQTDADESVTSSSPKPDELLTQQAQLKELLKNPSQAGTEMTVSQFRRLESVGSNHAPKSCLKASSSLSSNYFGSESPKASVNQPDQRSTLKRGVSFSENVVMFIYQA